MPRLPLAATAGVTPRAAGTDPALDRLTLIVRGADTAAKDLTPESRGLDAIAGGFQQMALSDHEKLDREFPLYDALYIYCGGTLPLPQPTGHSLGAACHTDTAMREGHDGQTGPFTWRLVPLWV